MNSKALLGGAMTLSLLASALPAAAAVIETVPDANVATTPYTISFGGGSTLTFSNVSATTTAFESSIGVATTGSAEVFSISGEPDYLQLFSKSPFPSGDAGVFAAYSGPAGVPYSIAKGVLGFEYSLGDGVHYGLAVIGGTRIDSYYLQSTPGADLTTGVPEPAAWGPARLRLRPGRRRPQALLPPGQSDSLISTQSVRPV